MFSWVQNPVCRKVFNANGLGCSSPAATPPTPPPSFLSVFSTPHASSLTDIQPLVTLKALWHLVLK